MNKNPLELFANDVFTDEEMKKRVSDKAYDDYKKTLEDGPSGFPPQTKWRKP